MFDDFTTITRTVKIFTTFFNICFYNFTANPACICVFCRDFVILQIIFIFIDSIQPSKKTIDFSFIKDDPSSDVISFQAIL